VVSDVPSGVAVTGYVLDQANIAGAKLAHCAIAKPYLQFSGERDQPPLVRGLVEIHGL